LIHPVSNLPLLKQEIFEEALSDDFGLIEADQNEVYEESRRKQTQSKRLSLLWQK